MVKLKAQRVASYTLLRVKERLDLYWSKTYKVRKRTHMLTDFCAGRLENNSGLLGLYI
jgi:hypothetical protein